MSICVGCGLCCDGTLFAHVNLEPLESAEALTLRGVPIHVTDAGVRQFRQPCHEFTGESCQMYDDRPSICRSFSCRLLDGVDAGDVEERAARSLIDQARSLRDEVRPKLVALSASEHPESLGQLYRKLMEEIDRSSDRAAAQRENADLLFSVVALRRLLATHFESPTAADAASDESSKAVSSR